MSGIERVDVLRKPRRRTARSCRRQRVAVGVAARCGKGERRAGGNREIGTGVYGWNLIHGGSDRADACGIQVLKMRHDLVDAAGVKVVVRVVLQVIAERRLLEKRVAGFPRKT